MLLDFNLAHEPPRRARRRPPAGRSPTWHRSTWRPWLGATPSGSTPAATCTPWGSSCTRPWPRPARSRTPRGPPPSATPCDGAAAPSPRRAPSPCGRTIRRSPRRWRRSSGAAWSPTPRIATPRPRELADDLQAVADDGPLWHRPRAPAEPLPAMGPPPAPARCSPPPRWSRRSPWSATTLVGRPRRPPPPQGRGADAPPRGRGGGQGPRLRHGRRPVRRRFEARRREPGPPGRVPRRRGPRHALALNTRGARERAKLFLDRAETLRFRLLGLRGRHAARRRRPPRGARPPFRPARPRLGRGRGPEAARPRDLRLG